MALLFVLSVTVMKAVRMRWWRAGEGWRRAAEGLVVVLVKLKMRLRLMLMRVLKLWLMLELGLWLGRRWLRTWLLLASRPVLSLLQFQLRLFPLLCLLDLLVDGADKATQRRKLTGAAIVWGASGAGEVGMMGMMARHFERSGRSAVLRPWLRQCLDRV